MELVKHKSEDEFIDLVISSLKPSSNSLSRISDTNRQSLKGLVKYLSKLKKENVIEAEQFSELITIACANFIENEVEIRLSKSIDKRIMVLFDKI